MHGLLFPKTIISVVICFFVLFSSVFSQKKATVEINLAKGWSHALGDSSGKTLAADWERVFLGLDGGKIEAVASSDGKKIWASEFGGDLSSNFFVSEKSLFFIISTVPTGSKANSGNFYSISKETGVTNWVVRLSDAGQYFLNSVNGSLVVVSKNGSIRSYDEKDGTLKWMRQISEDFVAQPIFTANSVFVATTAKQVFCISLASGEIETMRKLTSNVTALAETDGALIVGDERGNLSYFANSAGKAAWTFKSGGEISYILPVDGDVLVVSHDNFVYFLAGRNGRRIWKKRFAGRIAQITTAPNRYVRYAVTETFGESKIEVISLQTGKVAGQITLAEDENLSTRPVFDTNGRMVFITNYAVYEYQSMSFARK